MAGAPDRTILLTGASGYIGGQLLRRLEAGGRPVRCLTRRPEALRARVNPGSTEVVAGDVLQRASLAPALAGVHTAYYLVHSMGAPGDFEHLDRRAALNFGAAAAAAGVARIVYLGGLGRGDGLSAHLASRHEVGRLLRASGVPTIELRASIIIGSGSASFETIRALVEGLPAIVAPDWIETLAQPIAIEDVVEYLLATVDLDDPTSAIYEIGGADRVSYAEVMREYARQRGLHRRVVSTPAIGSRASRLALAWLAPDQAPVAAAMVDSLRNETVIAVDNARAAFAVRPRGLAAAIRMALDDEDRAFAETRWTDTLAPRPSPRRARLRVGRRLVSSRAVRIDSEPGQAFAPIQRIGGHTGWYGADSFWRLRGVVDAVAGGVGLRRGRRDRCDLRVGDPVDFWRVERFEAERLLRLEAEMRIPGRLWLQFEVAGHGRESVIRQTTVFDPAGFTGLAYWHLLSPVHARVFRRMLRAIGRAARSGAPENHYLRCFVVEP
ncbi:MAG: SDR family oxidoreductase [Actinomycetota bacterium]|nr:SDR family oxidoreductase [Actinomycetota bacterium]